MQNELTKDTILMFIKKDLLLGELDLENDGVTLESIEDDTPLLGEGLSIDSVDTLDLLVALEKKYELELPDLSSSFIESTCKNVGTLADFVLANLNRPLST